MSMIACYLRLAPSQLQCLARSPETLAQLHQNIPPGGEFIDLDKAAEVIAWLLSPCKRAEQVEFAAIMKEEFGEESQSVASPQAIPPLDDLAICIEGRGNKKIEGLELGYGPACEFPPDDVQKFAVALDQVSEDVLRRELNFELMDTQYLPVEYWLEEGEEIFTKYIVPQFEKLQRFYHAAAIAGQSVLVWHC